MARDNECSSTFLQTLALPTVWLPAKPGYWPEWLLAGNDESSADRFCWSLLNFEIRTFPIRFSSRGIIYILEMPHVDNIKQVWTLVFNT